MDINEIFPLKVKEENSYAGMGEYSTRYYIELNNGASVCSCDYEPKFIDEMNKIALKR